MCKDQLVAKKNAILLSESIKRQKRFISLDPDFLICYVKYYCKNLSEVQGANSNVFSKVFEANIINTLSSVSDGECNVDKMFIILSQIAYHIHINSSYPIDIMQINSIIQEYNDTYDGCITSFEFVNRMTTSGIWYSDGNGFRFKNRNVLAFFIANEILNLYNEDSELAKSVINKILMYSCFGINSDILMFISYLTNNVSILLLMLDKALEFTKGWEEFSFEGSLPKIFTHQAPHRISMVTEEEINETAQLELQDEKDNIEENEIETVDIYSYSEKDIDDPFNQIVRSFALLMIVAKTLPSFEHQLKKEPKKKIIETIYQLPNRIFHKWATEADAELEGLIKYIYEHSAHYSNKSLYGEQIMAGIQYTSLTFLLDLYSIAVYNSTKENTYKLLSSQFEYSNNATYALQHTMMTEECGTSNELIEELLGLSDRFNKKILENSCLRIIANHSITHQKKLSPKNISLIKSKIFTIQAKGKSQRILIPSNNSTKESATIIDRAKNQKK